jgi:hypothetical protein
MSPPMNASTLQSWWIAKQGNGKIAINRILSI